MLRAASEFASNAALIFSSTIRLLSRLAAAPPFASFAILNTMTAGVLAPNLIELATILGQEVFLLRMAAASFEYATIDNYDKCKSILTVEAIFWERLMKLDRDMDLIRQLLLEIEGVKPLLRHAQLYSNGARTWKTPDGLVSICIYCRMGK